MNAFANPPSSVELLNQHAEDFAETIAKSQLNKGFELEHLFTYTDESGNPIYWKIRLKNPKTGEKWIRSLSLSGDEFVMKEPDFATLYPAGKGKKPLYRLSDILNAPQDAIVFIVEGEQKADALLSFGIAATSSGAMTSAGKTNFNPLAGRTVRIWRDNDEAGLKYQQALVPVLHGLGCHVSVIEVEKLGLPEKGDVIDWLYARKAQGLKATMQDFLNLPFIEIEDYIAANDSTVQDEVDSKPLFTRADEMIHNLKPMDWLVHGYFEAHGVSQIFGAPAAGKSFLSVDLACCVATGTDWHGHKVKQGGVIYIAGEGNRGFAHRTAAWEKVNAQSLDDAPLWYSNQSFDFADKDQFDALNDYIQSVCAENKIALVIVDTVARAMSGDENHNEAMKKFWKVVDYLKDRYDCAVLLVHHTGHTNHERGIGSSIIGRNLDVDYCITKDGTTVRMEAKKMKETDLPPSLAFTISDVQLSQVDEDGQPIVKGAIVSTDYTKPIVPKMLKLGANQELAMKALHQLIDAKDSHASKADGETQDVKVTLEEWKEAFLQLGGEAKRFNETIKPLAGRHALVIIENDCVCLVPTV